MDYYGIYVCDNQPILVEGLHRVLEGCTDLRIVGHGPDLATAIGELTLLRAHLLLIGQPFTAKSILPLLWQAKEAGVEPALVLWVGELSEMDSLRALQMGARGILRKTHSPSRVIECLRTVAQGSIFFESGLRSPGVISQRRSGALRITRRERQIIEFVCRGSKTKDIADSLGITPGTVKVHLMHIFEKTGVKDRFQLALQGRHFLEVADEELARKAAEA